MPTTMKATRTEKATLISTTSGMPLCAGRCQDQAVFERHEANDLAHGVASRHHHQEAEQHDGEGKSQILARQRVGIARNPEHDDHGQSDEPHAGEHGGADADDVLDLAVDAEAGDDPVQRRRE